MSRVLFRYPWRANASIDAAFGRAACLGLLLLLAVPCVSDAAPAGTDAGRYTLQSNIWVNLHQRLLYEARFEGTPPAALTGDALGTWQEAVAAYRTFVGRRSPILDAELIRINTALSSATGPEPPDSIPQVPNAALRKTMPLYRAAQWDQDDRANRFWIAIARTLLESAGEDLVAAHERAYGMPFPKRILVDVTAFAWQFGAYTVGEGESAHAVISSTDPGNHGLAQLESLMHEPSHAIVGDTVGAIGADLTRLAGELDVTPRHNLWHAILFYTSGELTRAWLARHGVDNYRPFIAGMYERGLGGFEEPLETHWQAYLDGKLTREEALRRILTDPATQARPR